MKYKGITYDIGTEYRSGEFSRNNLNESVVKSDMDVIKNSLYCNSIRIYGKDTPLLIMASEIALQYGLNVWISPRLINENETNTLLNLKDVANKFESLKNKYTDRELVFIVGGELTIDMNCFVAGATIHERVSNLVKPLFFIKSALGLKPKYQKSFNKFLKDASRVVREEFSGKVTYAGAIWETVEWNDFDFISINLYKASFNASTYEHKLRKAVSLGKPFIITEFGCCCYDGADKRGPTGYSVLDTSKVPPLFKEKCIRNEKVQSNYILELLQIYERENVEGAFIFDFYSQRNTYNRNPEYDFDMAGFSITKSIGENKWEPKDSFFKIAEYYIEN
jgi:hypothetical protein